MSEKKQCGNRDYSKFDEMSTETLNEILRMDSQLPNDEESDIAAIMYIMEVVASREEENIKDKISDVDTAWKIFNEKYRPYSGDGKSLYEDDEKTDSPCDIEAIPFKVAKHSSAKGKGRGLLRVASIAAIIVALAFAGTVTSYALGYDLWGAVAEWSKETFGFVSQENSSPLGGLPNSDSSAFNDLQSALTENGIDQRMVPAYIPDGYVQTEFYITDIAEGVQFYAAFTNNDDNIIIIEVLEHTNQFVSQYQKDDEDPEIYEVNGIDHYIMTNMNKHLAVWKDGMLEGSISGLESKDELIEMINSIY